MGFDSSYFVRHFPSDRQARAVWAGLLVATGAGLSLLFACAAPFAAIAALAALKLKPRDAIAVIALVWLINQAVGYGMLGYPWSIDSICWGMAIGLSSYAGWLTAMVMSSGRAGRMAISLPFVGAFAAYELGLYLAGWILPEGTDAFSASILERIFVLNLFAFVGLLITYWISTLIGFQAGQSLPEKAAVSIG